MKRLLLLVVLLYAVLPQAEHKFYVGLTDMVVNRNTERLEITHRYFLDDMEAALSHSSEETIRIEESMQAEILPLLEEYLSQRFSIEDGDDPVSLEFLGYEIDNDLLWCYMEGPLGTDFSELTVQNSVLMEVYPGQTNLVHLDMNGTVTSLFLNAETYRGQLQ